MPVAGNRIRTSVMVSSRLSPANPGASPAKLTLAACPPMLTLTGVFVAYQTAFYLIAYRFGAVFLAEAYPSGPGRPDREM